MFYYLYKITNWFNGKIYIGVHRTENLDDGYMGSGKLLKAAIAKYGIEYFTKDILQQFDSAEAMFDAESQVVNEAFVKALDTYNIKLGGFGGWNHIEQTAPLDNSERAMNMNKKIWSDEDFRARHIERLKKRRLERYDHFSGRSHSEETLSKMRESHKGKHSAEKNSQFGTCWVHLQEVEDSAKKIRKEELETWLGLGWSRGRK